jgi:hypothetical protein
MQPQLALGSAIGTHRASCVAIAKAPWHVEEISRRPAVSVTQCVTATAEPGVAGEVSG